MIHFTQKIAMTLALTIGLFVSAVAYVNAQNLSRGKGVGQSGSGTDVWTTTIAGLGLFRAHHLLFYGKRKLHSHRCSATCAKRFSFFNHRIPLRPLI